MRYYTGIGSRKITKREEKTISGIALYLKRNDFTVYSGNASGADVTFQRGSGGNCVVFVPWKSFNESVYNYIDESKFSVCIEESKDREAYESVEKFHPNPRALTRAGRNFMARNYYQVMGYGEYPVSEFVVCCADEDRYGEVTGGTGQAVRIAKSLGLPIINIRTDGWLKKIKQQVKGK